MSDLIDRKAAYDAIMREGRNVDSRYLESERIIHECDAVEAIAMLPTIDAEPVRHGYWIDDCTCSVCLWTHTNPDGYALVTNYNYCPTCGAKMEVDDETD